jgi:hypothetical protein
MRPWTIAAAVAALIAAAWWHFPAAAQRVVAQPAASEAITFEQYRDFRLYDLAQRQARLARQLAAPGLSAAEKTSLECRLARQAARELSAASGRTRPACWRTALGAEASLEPSNPPC